MRTNLFFITALILLCQDLYAARYYVDSASGNDLNDGRTPLTAWKTLYKVNGAEVMPGDSILLKRGGVWRDQLKPHSGSPEKYVTYSCYGSSRMGKPLILGSSEGNDPGAWKNSGGNIWTIVPARKSGINGEEEETIKVDIGNLIFNGGESCGVKVWNIQDVNAQGKYWHDAEKSTVSLWSVENPARYYRQIELAERSHIVDQSGKSYVKYENLDLRCGAAHGFGGGSVHHIVIKNCDLSFIGGGLQYMAPGNRPVRFGNGIEFWDNAHDCYVIGCRIGEVYDAALTNQGKEDVAQYNIYYWNNIVWNSEYSFEYWLGNNSKGSHIYFENNTCVNAGEGWGHLQRPDGRNGRHLMFYNNRADIDHFYIRNNIFSESTESAWRLAKTWNGLDNLFVDRNIYYETEGKVADWQGESFSKEEFEKFQKASGKDQSSLFADPCFRNLFRLDLRLRKNSPGINQGMDTGNFQNPWRSVAKRGSHVDIGAVESR